MLLRFVVLGVVPFTSITYLNYKIYCVVRWTISYGNHEWGRDRGPLSQYFVNIHYFTFCSLLFSFHFPPLQQATAEWAARPRGQPVHRPDDHRGQLPGVQHPQVRQHGDTRHPPDIMMPMTQDLPQHARDHCHQGDLHLQVGRDTFFFFLFPPKHFSRYWV